MSLQLLTNHVVMVKFELKSRLMSQSGWMKSFVEIYVKIPIRPIRVESVAIYIDVSVVSSLLFLVEDARKVSQHILNL